MGEIPKGFRPQSPGLRGTSYPGDMCARFLNPERGCVPFPYSCTAAPQPSIPNVTLVPFQVVLAQQCPKLVLKSHFLVMLWLIGNVSNYPFQIRLTHAEIGVASLPLKIEKIATLFLEPKIRDAFEFFYPLSLRDGACKTAQQMDMVFNSTHDQRRTIELFGN